jgi:hypothetical protein
VALIEVAHFARVLEVVDRVAADVRAVDLRPVPAGRHERAQDADGPLERNEPSGMVKGAIGATQPVQPQQRAVGDDDCEECRNEKNFPVKLLAQHAPENIEKAD